MAILVTGGAGFIGAYLVRQLLARGERVVVYDLVPRPNVADEVLTAADRDHLPMLPGDVAA